MGDVAKLKERYGDLVISGSLLFRPHILLAEDDPDHQLIISRMLCAMGADVIVVGNGQSAVGRALQAKAEGTPFDLVLMDVRMPVMDGDLAIRRLRDGGYSLPVVAMTANAMKGDREKLIAAGFNDYISKPFSEGALAKLVERRATRCAKAIPM